MMRVGLAFVTVLIVAALARPAGARKWVDATGDHSVEAELADFRDGVVRLKTDDGRTISLPLARLSAADQEYVRHLSIDEPVCEQPSEARAAESGSAESSGKESAPAEPATDEPEDRPSSKDRQPIPKTGGGLSGFIAYGLWQVYQFFPFEGTWDWLLLVFVLAVASHVVFLPHLWKVIQSDMKSLSEHKPEGLGQTAFPSLWEQFCMWMLVWFFHSEAGRTLLAGRSWTSNRLPSETAGGLFWVSLALHFLLVLSLVGLVAAVEEKRKSCYMHGTGPFSDRGFLSLFAGGGVAIEKGKSEVEALGTPLQVETSLIFLAHLFYWYWSIASLTIMLCFTLAAVLNEAVRMWFVYVLHKRTFG